MFFESHNLQTTQPISVFQIFFFFNKVPTTGHTYHTRFKLYTPLASIGTFVNLVCLFSPFQNVSKGEINRFHIALYFLTHALLSQVKLFLTFFSVNGRGHISILFLQTWKPVQQSQFGLLWPHCILHTLISHSDAQNRTHTM